MSGCSRDAQTNLASQQANPGESSVATANADAAAVTAKDRKSDATDKAGQGNLQPAASDSYVVKRVLQIDGPFRHGDYVWDDEGVPPGQIVITVDLKAETLSVFQGGYEIGAAVILFGADEKPTPTGVYPITQKDADHVSNLYNSAPMPYMLRMTNDGISIHGSEVDWGYATHGCIGVPVAFAKKMFGVAKLGDKIIVTNGERLKSGQAITAI
ncbi:L,D-transpeptidase family protein [Sphingorhabdus soli]|uniref:L,D-transpeptidase family protein n=2 Tax=Flavisphingopyxis soli TaxID=2601267 RepID=A0A5C6UMH5_9SPHN|nr:L,D-transpeptidase family protein [Sphingorhabdus soli]